MVLAAAQDERTIDIIEIKEPSELVCGGLAGVAAIALRLIVREKGNGPPSSFITKGGANTCERALEKSEVVGVEIGDHKGTPI